MFDIVGISFYGWFLLTVIAFVLANLVASQRVKNWGENVYEETKCNENDGFVNRETNGSSQTDGEEAASIAAKLEYDGVSSQAKTVSQPSIPETRGPDAESVEWINNSLRWLYSQCNASVLVESWLSALNARARKASTENDILVEFECVKTWSLPPMLCDLYTTSESNNDVMTTGRVKSENLGLKILTSHGNVQNKSTVEYDVIIEKLEGKLKIFSNMEEVIFVVYFVDRPDIKLTLKPSDGSPKYSTHGQRSVEDAIVNAFINAIATATVDLHLAKQRNFPKGQHRTKVEDSQKYSDLSICLMELNDRRKLLCVPALKA
ncbi:uncharacterized protein LOC143235814 [Tachypleus tridentatus]|uniref:uncharacterized protein LOC143235814 n=1 Tax=Tachypleus tridentatus TaxID=6853 RepID=UPI003FD53C26